MGLRKLLGKNFAHIKDFFRQVREIICVAAAVVSNDAEILARGSSTCHGSVRKMKKERTVITAAIFQRITVHPGPHTTVAWCDHCGAEVLMLTPNEAAVLAQSTTREIFRRVEAGEIHFLETEDGVLLVCRNSLEPPRTMKD
jgi:hypothetical protein